MSKTLMYLSVATAAVGALVLANTVHTSNGHDVGGQSLKSEHSALTVTGSITPIATRPIIASDSSISTYGLEPEHPTDY
jgi:hypothetical protein